MGGKHLKKLRAEKSKVKLKQKKKLPKGQNITDTSFKVKKIVTVEQLKKVDKNEPVSAWNVPLKDLLIRLNHYNHTSRLNSLNGIGELIVNYPHTLEGHSLQLTVTRVLELLSDDDHKIRVTAIKLLNNIFEKLPSSSIVPFYDILNVHLACVMTNRKVGVQQDSLKFIDVMLKFAPDAIKKNFHIIFQNFTRILGSYKYGSHSEVLLTKGSKLDLEKEKAEMLFRFYQILVIVYSMPEEKINAKNNVSIHSSAGKFSMRALQGEFKKIPDLSSLFKMSRRKENNKLLESENSEFQKYCSVMIPILFDAWSECIVNKQNDGFSSECVLSEETAHLLLIILKILLLLQEKISKLENSQLEWWFTSTYGPGFRKAFLSNFPYVPPVSIKKLDFTVNGELTHTNSTAYLIENLILCYLYYSFKIKPKSSDQENKIEKYVTGVLLAKNPSGVEILTKILEVMLNSKPKKLDFIVNVILKAHSVTASPELRRSLFKLIVQIALNEKFVACWDIAALVKWAKALPARLLKPRISLHVIDAILKLMSRSIGQEVVKEIESKVGVILENLPRIRIEGSDQFEGQKLIANILYWCRNEVLEEVVRKGTLQKNSYPPDLKSYITEIFSYKLINQDLS